MLTRVLHSNSSGPVNVLRYASSRSNNLIERAQLFRADKKKPLFILDSGKDITYGRFVERMGQYAATLSEKYGIQKGDRVLARTTKNTDNVALYMGCLQLGAIYIPVNPAYTHKETAHYVQDSEPKLFITCDLKHDHSFKDRVREVIDERAIAFESADVRSATDVEHVNPSDVACICYTSGTTGLPKGAMLTHGSLSSNAISLRELWRFTEDDRLLHMLPFYHVHGMFISLNCSLFSHSSVIFRQKFDVSDCLKWMPQSTVMMGVPTFYSRLLLSHEFTGKTADNIRLFVSGSAPLSLATWEQFEQRTGKRILERYGMTEAQVICSNLYEENGRVPGSVGQPLPGTQLRLNEHGGIEIKSDSLFAGYWRNEQKTKVEFTSDGFFITGDVANIDERGFVRIHGRSKDLIICGGLNVYPKEIEDFVDKMDIVHESAIIGVPHKDFGEVVVAVVALENCHSNPEKLEANMIKELREQFAPYKVPKRILVVEELPRNSMAKVQKNVLREQYKNLFGAA